MDFDIRREMRIYGSQTDLAAKLKKSRSFISAIYTGKKGITDEVLKELGWERETVTKYRKIKK